MIDQDAPYRRHSFLPQKSFDWEALADLRLMGLQVKPVWVGAESNPPTARRYITPRPKPADEKDKDGRVPLAFARERAEKLLVHLRPACERIAVAGSLRRGKSTIKDIELVVIPRGRELWDLLDDRLLQGKIEKAVYGHKDGKPQYRWDGSKYRGFVWAGMKIEVFATTPDNWGYIYWLRTGPHDANTALMTALKHKDAPFKFEGGYAVLGLIGERLPLREEMDLFNLCGLPYIEPHQRTPQRYWHEFNDAHHHWFKEAMREPA